MVTNYLPSGIALATKGVAAAFKPPSGDVAIGGAPGVAL